MVRRGQNIRAEISLIKKITLKATRGISRYNTTTKKFIEEIVERILSHTNIKPSCVSSNVVKVLNPESNQKEFSPKMLMDITVRDLHNDTIKPSDDGGLESVVDSVTQKVLISDTTFRLFIPPQVRKLTTKLCQICGCELCIIPKDMQIDLDLVQTKMSPTLSFSGMYLKPFIYGRNKTNSQ